MTHPRFPSLLYQLLGTHPLVIPLPGIKEESLARRILSQAETFTEGAGLQVELYIQEGLYCLRVSRLSSAAVRIPYDG